MNPNYVSFWEVAYALRHPKYPLEGEYIGETTLEKFSFVKTTDYTGIHKDWEDKPVYSPFSMPRKGAHESYSTNSTNLWFVDKAFIRHCLFFEQIEGWACALCQVYGLDIYCYTNHLWWDINTKRLIFFYEGKSVSFPINEVNAQTSYQRGWHEKTCLWVLLKDLRDLGIPDCSFKCSRWLPKFVSGVIDKKDCVFR